jgi:hypothetical protein
VIRGEMQGVLRYKPAQDDGRVGGGWIRSRPKQNAGILRAEPAQDDGRCGWVRARALFRRFVCWEPSELQRHGRVILHPRL